MRAILIPSNPLIRLRHAYRRPYREILAGRIAIAGQHLPARAPWRREPRGRRAAQQSRPRKLPVVGGPTTAGPLTRRGRAALMRRSLPLFIAGIGVGAVAGVMVGAVAMYYLDVDRGRRRRALMRDKIAHAGNVLTRRVPRTVERRGRFLRGVAKGITHEATDMVLHPNGQRGAVPDDTLVARVRSEALRSRDVKAGEIHVDAYEGCVTLRGQLEQPEDIRRLVEATKHVDGVREVRSYLHLPGTPPPNKADVYARVPEHMAAR